MCHRLGISQPPRCLSYSGRLTVCAQVPCATSQALFLEYEAVLSRPEQRAVHQFNDERLEALLRDLADLVTPVPIRYRFRPQLRDPGDELVLEAAINGSANVIVTHNVRDFLPATTLFGIEVLTPGSILKERLLP